MIDRTALLLPKLKASGKAYPDLLDDALRYLRIGYAAGELRKRAPQVRGEANAALGELLSEIATCFGGARAATPADIIGLDQRVEALMALMTGNSPNCRSRIVDLLIDLRFAFGSHGTSRGTSR